MLDVAAGNGNAALAAARRNATVIVSDYVPALLEKAAAPARAEGTALETRVADAEALPFGDISFDATVSVFGVMFAPRQSQVASELVRVTKPGGRIGLINWTPNSFIAELFATVSKHVPPPPIASGFNWGERAKVAKLLGSGVTLNTATTRDFPFRYRSAEHFVDVFRTFCGPTHKAFAALDADGQLALERDLIDLCNRWNRSQTGALLVPSEYLEVVATVG